MKKLLWFNAGLVVGLTLLSFAKASVPSKSRLTDGTAIDQSLSELTGVRKAKVDFDSDIENLDRKEVAYLEKSLPLKTSKKSDEKKTPLTQKAELKGPLSRVDAPQKYVPIVK